MAYKYSADTTVDSGMPVWFDDERELPLLKEFGRELVENLIRQKVLLYSVDVELTKKNLYGESKRKTFSGPITMWGRVQIQDVDVDTLGGIRRPARSTLTFSVYEDHIAETGAVIKVGDFLLFENKYYEISDAGLRKDENQRRVGVTREFFLTILATEVSRDIFDAK